MYTKLKTQYGPLWYEYLDLESPFYYPEYPITSIVGDNRDPLFRTSLVHINFDKPEAMVTTKDAKVTFADKLGSIGGTFGVFLGLSFVGILDFGILICKGLIRVVHNKCNK